MKITQETILSSVIVDENTTFTIREICTRCNIPYQIIIQMAEHGLFDLSTNLDDDTEIDLKTLKRIEAAFRLHQDLEINMPGVSLILELKDQIDLLQQQLDLLNKLK